MTLLALETSCDETSAAVIRDGLVLANVVSSQISLHADYGGIVPELATREHLRNLSPVTRTAMRETGASPADLDAVAATRGPGLPGALMTGCKAAQALAFALRKPFLGIHHHEAHLYSPWIRAVPSHHNRERAGMEGGGMFVADFGAFEPHVALIVSGGHTMLVCVDAESKHRLLGSTVDDAAGECFDKTAKLIGLPYPGGPEMDRLAEDGNPGAVDFPRPMMNEPNDDFSFSGLKTSVRYFLRDHPEVLDDAARRRDLCASVRAAIVDVLVAKTIRAARRMNVRCVTASGGVTLNRALRRELAEACEKNALHLRLAEEALCTDNAAMIGILAERRLVRGAVESAQDVEILPGWPLN